MFLPVSLISCGKEKVYYTKRGLNRNISYWQRPSEICNSLDFTLGKLWFPILVFTLPIIYSGIFRELNTDTSTNSLNVDASTFLLIFEYQKPFLNQLQILLNKNQLSKIVIALLKLA